MRVLSPLISKKSIGNPFSFFSQFFRREKSGLSEMISYVLLISISVSLSILVYGWLRFYVSEDSVDTCSSDINVIITRYECLKTPSDSSNPGHINITLKNKGLFNVDGFELRVHNESDATFGIYLFDNEGNFIAPGEEYSKDYGFDLAPGIVLTDIKLIEVQPFVIEDGRTGSVRCKSRAIQRVECQD